VRHVLVMPQCGGIAFPAGQSTSARDRGATLAPWRTMQLVRDVRILPLVALVVGSSGCRVIGDIFKAGVWVGVLVIGVVVLLGFGLASMFRGR
jgi:hypothetical protein